MKRHVQTKKSPRPMVKSKDYLEPTFSITISFVILTNHHSVSLLLENEDNMTHPAVPDISQALNNVQNLDRWMKELVLLNEVKESQHYKA